MILIIPICIFPLSLPSPPSIWQPFAHVAMLLFTKTAKQGAQTPIHCAVAPEVEGQDGAYWDHCAIVKPIKRALDDKACEQLWDYSAKLVGLE